MSYTALAYLFAGAVTLHDLEEALFLLAWERAHLKLPFYPNPKALWIATSLASVLVWIAALGAGIWPAASLIRLALAGFAATMVVNAFLPHLAISLFKRSYSPGTGTALLLKLPLGLMLIRAQLRRDAVSPVHIWLPILLCGALLGIVVLGSLFALTAWFNRRATKCGTQAPLQNSA